MTVTIEEIESELRKDFPNATINIEDIVGDQNHYSLKIADNCFASMPLIAQHRMVKDSLKELLKARLHAITISTKVK